MPPDGELGGVVINNYCEFDVFYDNVPEQGRGMDEFGTIKAGDSYRTSFDAPQIGHSLKLSLYERNNTDVLQFEYSTTMDMHIDYDVSIVDGNPFNPWGFSLDADSGCPTVRCEVPVDGCTGVYIQPAGNADPNYYCWLSAHVGLTLCSG
ncbi:MAG: hypothetical protein Q9162_007409 [Coniocarpon cinnabarinum]